VQTYFLPKAKNSRHGVKDGRAFSVPLNRHNEESFPGCGQRKHPSARPKVDDVYSGAQPADNDIREAGRSKDCSRWEAILSSSESPVRGRNQPWKVVSFRQADKKPIERIRRAGLSVTQPHE